MWSCHRLAQNSILISFTLCIITFHHSLSSLGNLHSNRDHIMSFHPSSYCFLEQQCPKLYLCIQKILFIFMLRYLLSEAWPNTPIRMCHYYSFDTDSLYYCWVFAYGIMVKRMDFRAWSSWVWTQFYKFWSVCIDYITVINFSYPPSIRIIHL